VTDEQLLSKDEQLLRKEAQLTSPHKEIERLDVQHRAFGCPAF
jgi:hypothetical protein